MSPQYFKTIYTIRDNTIISQFIRIDQPHQFKNVVEMVERKREKEKKEGINPNLRLVESTEDEYLNASLNRRLDSWEFEDPLIITSSDNRKEARIERVHNKYFCFISHICPIKGVANLHHQANDFITKEEAVAWGKEYIK